jgi:hypothetical protein
VKEIWETFKKMFDDSGLTRKICLLRDLTTMRLEKSGSIDEYINKILAENDG